MVAGAWLAVTPARRKGPVGAVAADGTTQPRPAPAAGKGAAAEESGGRKRAGRGSGSFMHRIEQRWERRRGGGWDA